MRRYLLTRLALTAPLLLLLLTATFLLLRVAPGDPVTATLGAEFRVVMRDRVSDTNSLVLASRRPLSASRQDQLPAEVRPTANTVDARVVPALSGGTVYTDDKAPVEWLTDLSLLRYAAGDR